MAKQVSVKGSGRIPIIVGGKIDRRAEKKAVGATKVDKRHRLDAAGWVATGREVKVKSSNVYSIQYSKVDKRLKVRFQQPKGSPGPYYYYNGVSTQAAKAMFDAASMGKFVWRRLRDKYPYEGPFR